MASRAGHYEVAEFLLQNAAPVDAKAKVDLSHKRKFYYPKWDKVRIGMKDSNTERKQWFLICFDFTEESMKGEPCFLLNFIYSLTTWLLCIVVLDKVFPKWFLIHTVISTVKECQLFLAGELSEQSEVLGNKIRIAHFPFTHFL